MLHRIYEVMAVASHKAERSDEHGSTTSYTVLEVHVKIPDEEIRCGWPQLYAFVSIFYVPLLIDALWVYCRGPIKLIVPKPSNDFSKPIESSASNKETEPCWKEILDDARKNPLIFLLALPCYVIGIATAVVGVPWLLSVVFLVRAVSIIGGCLFSVVGNLYAALLCKETFSNGFLSIGKIRADDGTETWELNVQITYDGGNLFVPSPPFSSGSLKTGDRVLVGFGPFSKPCAYFESGHSSSSKQYRGQRRPAPGQYMYRRLLSRITVLGGVFLTRTHACFCVVGPSRSQRWPSAHVPRHSARRVPCGGRPLPSH